MPIYPYECSGCGERGEYFVHSIDGDPSECLECHGPDLTRVRDPQMFNIPSNSGGSPSLYAPKPSELVGILIPVILCIPIKKSN